MNERLNERRAGLEAICKEYGVACPEKKNHGFTRIYTDLGGFFMPRGARNVHGGLP